MAKLGTKPRPAVVRVQTEERAMELLDLCNMPEIQVIIGIEPDKQEERHQAYPAAAGTGKGASTDRQKRLLPLWLGKEVQEVLRGTNGYLLISADKPALQHRAKWPISRDCTFGAIQSGGMIAPAQTFGSSEREPSRTTRLLLKKKCDKYLTIG